MLIENHPGYVNTEDGARIFFNTNFSHVNFDKSRPLLTFNYGLVCSNHHWSKQLPFFDQLGYQILIHNYRGHYNSSAGEGIESVTFDNIVSDLNQILNKFSGAKTIMLGHSMGVNITLEYAKLFPKQVIGQILISGSVFPPQDVMFNSNIMDLIFPYLRTFRKKAPNLYGKIWQTGGMNPLAREFIHRGGFNYKKTDKAFVETYMNLIGSLPPELFYQLLDEMKAHSIIAHLTDIETPALIIGGDQDQVIPNYIQRIIHEHLPNSSLYLIKDGSHVPQVDFPEIINERIFHYIKHLEKAL